MVRVDHLYPEALLTPFTDNVDLTDGDGDGDGDGDERANPDQAKAQRAKALQFDITYKP